MSFEQTPPKLENPLEAEDVGLSEVLQSQTPFDDLYAKLRKLGEIQGTQKEYSAEDIIKIIARVRNGHRTANYIPRTYGLKSIVEQLLEKDKTYNSRKTANRLRKKL